MALYTPFAERTVDKVAGAIQQKNQTTLAQSAYMGDTSALNKLASINPEFAQKIQMQKNQQDQAKMQQARQAQEDKVKHHEMVQGIAKQTVNMSLDEANDYAQRQGQSLGIQLPLMTQEHHDQIKKAYGSDSSGAFAGKGMEAQTSNMLIRGAEDPEFRNTPEYAEAWRISNEPKVIRTPTGDILQRPEINAMFKPPGSPVPESEEIANIKASAKKDIEVIAGTEKKEKTTADEKLSYGFYSRMEKAERSIEDLGDFNSADYWERLKGVTNITSSPELQQYRQAADDWIRSKLRRESGAAIAPDEMDSEYKIYFPQIGDSQEVIRQKEKARATAVNAMRIASGGEFDRQEKEPTVGLKGAPPGYAERRAKLLGGQ